MTGTGYLGTWHYALPKETKMAACTNDCAVDCRHKYGMHCGCHCHAVKAEECPACGGFVAVSDWPFCPHGKEQE